MATDNRLLLNPAESNTGWAGNDTANDSNDPGSFYEGAQGLSTQLTNVLERMTTTSIGSPRNMSNATVWFLVKDNLAGTKAAGGFQIVLTDNPGAPGADEVGFFVNGNDDPALQLPTFFQCLRLDVSNRSVLGNNAYAGSAAALDDSHITGVGYGSIHLAKAVGAIDNVFMDASYFIVNGNAALTIDSGTSSVPITFSDIVTEDIAQGWGIFSNLQGDKFDTNASFEWAANIGSPNANSFFTESNFQLFIDARDVGAGNFIVRTRSGTGTNELRLTNGTIVNLGTPTNWDLSDGDFNVTLFNSVTWSDAGTIKFARFSSGNREVNDSVFNTCNQVDMQSITADSCSFNGTVAIGVTGSPFTGSPIGGQGGDADGAILWDEIVANSANQDNLTFVANVGSPRSRGHAIEVRPLGVLNGSPGVALGSPETRTYNVDGYTFDGYSTGDGTFGSPTFQNLNAIWFINPESDTVGVTINLSNSSAINPVGGGTDNFSFRRRRGYTGIVSIVSTVTVTITVLDVAGDPIANAQTAVFLTADDSEIINADTNGSGVASGSFGGAVPAAVSVRVRKNSPGDTRFFPVNTPATIESTGLSLTVTLQEDAIAV